MIDTKYQFFDDLSDGEYQSLKSSIETHGVLVPVEYDDAGNVLDGHHRLKACAELGITIWERLIRKGLSEADKKNHVRTLNIVRRQLTNEQRKKCWADMRQDGMTLSAIAAADGTVSINTVKSAIDNSTLQNCKVEPTKVIGKDGKARLLMPRNVIACNEIERERAKARQGTRTDLNIPENLPEGKAGDSRDIAAGKQDKANYFILMGGCNRKLPPLRKGLSLSCPFLMPVKTSKTDPKES